jgi:hypothetical protein
MKNKFIVYAVVPVVLSVGLIGANAAAAHGMFGPASNLSPDEIVSFQQNIFTKESQILGISEAELKADWAGSIEYFKLARGTTTLSAIGYYSQPPMVSPVLMGSAGFAAEVHSGQNGATTVNFDTIGFGQYGVNLSMKDCYDQYLRYKKNFATSGKNMHLKVTMNRGTAENISSIPGLDFKFDK